MKTGYRSTAEGFQITFKNGVTVSVMFSHTHYCSNRSLGKATKQLGKGKRMYECSNAEVCVWDNNRDERDLIQEYDEDINTDVTGHIEPDELLKILIWAENYKTEEVIT